MENENYRSIATKIPSSLHAHLKEISNERGLSLYEICQAAIYMLLRMIDEPHSFNNKEEIIAQELQESLNNILYDFKAQTKIDVLEAIVFCKCKKGTTAALIDNKCNEISYNIKTIFEKVFCTLTPKLYKTLRDIAQDINTNSVIETIRYIITDYTDRSITQDVEDLFSANDYHEFGNRQQDIIKYKGKYNKQMDF